MPAPWACALCVLALCVLASSCYRRPLYVYTGETARVMLEVDWQDFDQVPTGMTALFYLRDTTQRRQLVQVTTADVWSTPVDLPVGTYDALIFNQIESEYSNQRFRGMQRFASSEVYLLPLLAQPAPNAALYPTRSAADYADPPLVYEFPEAMAIDTLIGIEVTRGMVDETHLIRYEDRGRYENRDYVQVIHSRPHPILWTMHIRVEILGVQYMQLLRASIDGLAGGHWLGLDSRNTTPVYHALNDWTTVVDHDVDTIGWTDINLVTFGMRDFAQFRDSDVVLNLQFRLRDSRTLVDFHYDVANLIEWFPERRHLELLLIDGVVQPPQLPPVPPSDDGGASGFDAIVDPWGDEEHIDVIM